MRVSGAKGFELELGEWGALRVRVNDEQFDERPNPGEEDPETQGGEDYGGDTLDHGGAPIAGVEIVNTEEPQDESADDEDRSALGSAVPMRWRL